MDTVHVLEDGHDAMEVEGGGLKNKEDSRVIHVLEDAPRDVKMDMEVEGADGSALVEQDLVALSD